jgi:hypothetical protein
MKMTVAQNQMTLCHIELFHSTKVRHKSAEISAKRVISGWTTETTSLVSGIPVYRALRLVFVGFGHECRMGD